MNTVKGTIRPIRDNVLVTDMDFEEMKTASGIVIQSDDGKAHGVKPRWCRVWAIGPEQKDVKIDEWILIEHGRWTRGIKVEEDGEEIIIRRVELKSIMLQTDKRPNDFYIGAEYDASQPVTSRPEDFM